MDYSYLYYYKITAGLIEEEGVKSVGRFSHYFFPLPEFQIQKAVTTYTPFPVELLEFYNKIGFGFLNRAKGKFNILLDPASLINTNQRLDYYGDNPYLAEAAKYYDVEKQLLFFKTYSNLYFSINRVDVNGKNAIFHEGKQIHSSLYEFIEKCYDNSDYFNDFDFYIMATGEMSGKGKENDIQKEETKADIVPSKNQNRNPKL
jgi:hypothetical protein